MHYYRGAERCRLVSFSILTPRIGVRMSEIREMIASYARLEAPSSAIASTLKQLQEHLKPVRDIAEPG